MSATYKLTRKWQWFFFCSHVICFGGNAKIYIFQHQFAHFNLFSMWYDEWMRKQYYLRWFKQLQACWSHHNFCSDTLFVEWNLHFCSMQWCNYDSLTNSDLDIKQFVTFIALINYKPPTLRWSCHKNIHFTVSFFLMLIHSSSCH